VLAYNQCLADGGRKLKAENRRRNDVNNIDITADSSMFGNIGRTVEDMVTTLP